MDTLQDVRYLQNASRPVTRLPPEILSRIFLILQDQFIHGVRDPASIVQRMRQQIRLSSAARNPVRYRRSCFPSHPFAWMTIMRVCRRWHAVAKAYPALWSTIIFDEFFDFAPLLTVRSDEVYPSLFLDSSAAAPLTLSLSGSGQAHRLPGAHQLVPHLARAESLHLGGSILFSGAVALSQPAPRLKELVLSGSSAPPPTPPHTRQMLFAGSLPSLESLAFVNVPIRTFNNSFQSSYHQLRQL